MRRAIFAFLGLVAASNAQAQTLNVFAAASLKETATEIARAFELVHANVFVSLNFAGSQQLVAQIKQGASVDVLLSAGFEALKGLSFLKDSQQVFATNKLALIVPAGSHNVKSLEDLGRGYRIVIADSRVPVGNYTDQMIDRAEKALGYDWKVRFFQGVVSKEQDVRAVLAKVALGEADAGIVYVSDVPAAKGKVTQLPIPDKYNVEARYPAVRFAHSENDELAKEFMKFVLSSKAQATLKAHGFGPAPALTNPGKHALP